MEIQIWACLINKEGGPQQSAGGVMFVFLSKSFQESHTVLIPTNWPQDKEWVAALSLSGLLRRFTEERKVCRQARV